MRIYTMNGEILGDVNEQIDLGVHAHGFLKEAPEVGKVIEKVYENCLP